MRTMNKSKNKQGVVLVTILFILAIAMIFIASALLLTKATRGRIYVRAQDNQARLTVTSAAESFYQALFLQEIKDSDLQAMDGAVLEIVNPNMPGMESGHAIQSRFGENCPDDGQTIAEFEVGTNSAVINFKTNIGGQVECIQMGLQIKAPKTNKNNFPNVVEIGNGGSINNLTVGGNTAGTARYNAISPSGADMNTIAVHGTQATTNKGRTKIFSTYITTGHTAIRDTEFYGDVIFWGPEAGVEINSGKISGTPLDVKSSTVGVYFIGGDSMAYNNSTAFTATNNGGISNDWMKGNVPFIFNNEGTIHFESEQTLNGNISAIYSRNSQAPTIPDVNQNVNKLNSLIQGEPTGTYLTNMVRYTETNYAAGGENPADYTWNGINQSGWGGTGTLTSHRTGMVSLASKATSAVTNLTPGSYSLTGTLDNKIVNVDLAAGDYYFFIDSSFTFGAGGAIVAKNGTANNYACYIVIKEGAYLSFAGGDTRHGIISANCFKGVTFDDTQAELSSCTRANINQGVSPYVYIYGAGSGTNTALHTGGSNNDSGQIRFAKDNRSAIMTAYVGLYPTSYNAGTNTFSEDAGAITFAQGVNDNINVYGRLSASYVTANDGSNIQIPYCPEPNTDGLSDKPVPLYTDYRIYDYQYYTM